MGRYSSYLINHRMKALRLLLRLPLLLPACVPSVLVLLLQTRAQPSSMNNVDDADDDDAATPSGTNIGLPPPLSAIAARGLINSSSTRLLVSILGGRAYCGMNSLVLVCRMRT